MRKFPKIVCEDNLTQQEIHAALDDGKLHPYRVDGHGRQWYFHLAAGESPPPVRGVGQPGEGQLFFPAAPVTFSAISDRDGLPTIHGTPTGPVLVMGHPTGFSGADDE